MFWQGSVPVSMNIAEKQAKAGSPRQPQTYHICSVSLSVLPLREKDHSLYMYAPTCLLRFVSHSLMFPGRVLDNITYRPQNKRRPQAPCSYFPSDPSQGLAGQDPYTSVVFTILTPTTSTGMSPKLVALCSSSKAAKRKLPGWQCPQTWL